jgi:U-box domain
MPTDKKPIPKSFICPITQEIMLDPVIVTSSGKTYERNAIEQWLKNNNP